VVREEGLKNVQAMNHGGAATMEFGRVKMTAAVHSSSMPDGSYGGEPCGYVIESTDGSFYYSGDTALTLDMKLIAEQTSLRFAVLPVGDFYTMGIEDALRAAEFVGTSKVVGVHYDTVSADQARPRRRDAARDCGRQVAPLTENRRDHRRLAGTAAPPAATFRTRNIRHQTATDGQWRRLPRGRFIVHSEPHPNPEINRAFTFPMCQENPRRV
jgi:L-ascorbate metabolism protein UlaG (beta-lactamase superfamily)